MKYISRYLSPPGPVLLASDGEHLTGLWFEGQKYYALGLSDNPKEKDLPVFGDTRRWLDIYFSGKDPGFFPKMKLLCSPFAALVREEMLKIPFGKTVSYGEIATSIAVKTGKKTVSAQAVGGAVGHNSISVIIPCHRVLGSRGSLTGYAGGIDKKLWLLQNEGVDISLLRIPKISTAP